MTNGKSERSGPISTPLTASLPAPYCFPPFAFQELLGFIQPTLCSAVLIGGCGLDGFNAGLHRAGGLLVVTEPGVRPADEIQTLRVVRPAIQEPLQHVARIAVLPGG